MKTIESVSLVTFLEGATDGFVMFGSLFNFVNGTLDKSHYKLLTQEHVDAFKSRPDVFNVVELEEKAPAEKKAVEVKEELKEEKKEEKKEDKVEPVIVEKEEKKAVVEVKPEAKEVEKEKEVVVVEKPVEKKNSATKTKN